MSTATATTTPAAGEALQHQLSPLYPSSKGFEPFVITTQTDPTEVKIYGVKSSINEALPPLLLLHGFPENHRIWHLVAPQLLEQFTLVIPDLRGYGASSKPCTCCGGSDTNQEQQQLPPPSPSSERLQQQEVAYYAKSAMASDMAVLMAKLGHESSYVCAHDRGARVAHKLCVDYPGRVRRAMFLDTVPTLTMYDKSNQHVASAYFHWYFLIQSAPMPETLIKNSAGTVGELFMGTRGGTSSDGDDKNDDDGNSAAKKPKKMKTNKDLFHPECYDSYVHSLSDYASIHAMCNDYRAAATVDLAEARADLGLLPAEKEANKTAASASSSAAAESSEKGIKTITSSQRHPLSNTLPTPHHPHKGAGLITVPLRVLWGSSNKLWQDGTFNVLQEWQRVAVNSSLVSGHTVPNTGHYIPEESPQHVVEEIQRFFGQEEPEAVAAGVGS